MASYRRCGASAALCDATVTLSIAYSERSASEAAAVSAHYRPVPARTLFECGWILSPTVVRTSIPGECSERPCGGTTGVSGRSTAEPAQGCPGSGAYFLPERWQARQEELNKLAVAVDALKIVSTTLHAAPLDLSRRCEQNAVGFVPKDQCPWVGLGPRRLDASRYCFYLYLLTGNRWTNHSPSTSPPWPRSPSSRNAPSPSSQYILRLGRSGSIFISVV